MIEAAAVITVLVQSGGVLTIAHLDHTPENCAPHILRA
jgi:hypothetical protein